MKSAKVFVSTVKEVDNVASYVKKLLKGRGVYPFNLNPDWEKCCRFLLLLPEDVKEEEVERWAGFLLEFLSEETGVGKDDISLVFHFHKDWGGAYLPHVHVLVRGEKGGLEVEEAWKRKLEELGYEVSEFGEDELEEGSEDESDRCF
jgi:hypothetical protein